MFRPKVQDINLGWMGVGSDEGVSSVSLGYFISLRIVSFSGLS